jgi:hypothetical protein
MPTRIPENGKWLLFSVKRVALFTENTRRVRKNPFGIG